MAMYECACVFSIQLWPFFQLLEELTNIAYSSEWRLIVLF